MKTILRSLFLLIVAALPILRAAVDIDNDTVGDVWRLKYGALGAVKWKKDGFGPGHVVLTAGGTVLALSDAGELVAFAAKPDAYTELARAKVLEGKCWTTPVVANGLAFIRSTKEAACLDLRAK